MDKLLYIHRGALGDFVLCMPALRMLRMEFPHAEFVGLGRPEHLRLAKDFSLCDRIFDCESGIFAEFLDGRVVPETFDAADAAVLWLKEGTQVSSVLSSRSCRILSIAPFVKATGHVGLRYFDEISAFFFAGSKKNIFDFLPAATCAEGNLALIHPGSGSRAKNQPPEFYLGIAKKLGAMGMDHRFVFGPVEVEMGAHKSFPHEKSSFPADCIGLKNLIMESALFIGNDSGPTHLAAFCGVPTIAIFASTDPAIWRPLGRNMRWVDAASLTDSFIYGMLFDAKSGRYSLN